jgi:predicted ATP-grasp superfamily ATP-dependent carboligase
VFVAARGGAALAGVTRQLVGRPGAAFAYRGNVAPWPVSGQAAPRIESVGDVLAGRFGLVGLFGIDLILDGDGRPWPVEVNPRYTASVELIELATGRPLLDDHRRACEGRPVHLGRLWEGTGCHVAKEVVFAVADGVFEADPGEPWSPSDPFQVAYAADVPAPGTRYGAGDPVLTVFGRGKTPEEALRDLERARDDWARRLSGPVRGS